MRDFAVAVGQPLDVWRGQIAQMYRYFDARSAPEEWLDALMQVVGLPRNDALSAIQKRGLIAAAFDAWVWKGTVDGIEAYARGLIGPTCAVVRTNNHAFVAGVSQANDICGPGELAWTWELHVPASAGYSEPEIRTLLLPVTSSLETFTVEFF